MPHKSLREIRADLRRILRTDRYLDALLVVEDHVGVEIFRCGGRWDRLKHRYVSPTKDNGGTLAPRVVRVQESQVELARGFARWRAASLRNDTKRPRLIVAGGNRGSGKTWFLAGVALVAVELTWPGDWQFGVNLTSPQRRECVEAVEEVAVAGWIAFKSDDLRDPFLEFTTGGRVGWLSAQNPKRLRQAKLRIRHILLNEGQDQHERNYFNAVGAIRNVGGLVTVATNPPQHGAGDWVATIWSAIESDEVGHRGEVYKLDAKLNRAVDQVALEDIGVLIRAVSQEAADADSGGAMRLSGPVAYKNFVGLPVHKGGHVGDPPPVPHIGSPLWRDVTRERTAKEMGGGDGFDWIVGADFQRRPGIVGIACKLFIPDASWWARWNMPQPIDPVVLWAGAQVNCPGDESAFSEALERAGYVTIASGGNSALLVGDGTGARQNAAHRWDLPTSFVALKGEGWTIVPPRWTKKRKPENPTVKESRAQMWDGLNAHQILVSPRLKESEGGFVGLVPCFLRAQVNANGNLVGGYHHAPDGFRYVWWKFGPKPTPPRTPLRFDSSAYDAIRAITR